MGFYILIIRIPIKGGMTIPNIATFDHGKHNLEGSPALFQTELIGTSPTWYDIHRICLQKIFFQNLIKVNYFS